MRPRNRDGFTLIELLVVVMIVGSLAGMAVPNLRGAVLRADAAHVMADARAVGLAAHEYLSDTGRFPASASAGSIPPEMEAYLDGVVFDYKGLTYTWSSFDLTGSSGYNSNNLGIFYVEFGDRTDIGNALSAFAGPDAYWSETSFYIMYWD